MAARMPKSKTADRFSGLIAASIPVNNRRRSGKTMIMKEKTVKKDLHVRINIELYEKLRQISFYERRTLTEVISRLISEYVEEKAIEELDLTMPMNL